MTKIAMITGASRGIGAAVACRLAADGYHLALCCRSRATEMRALAQKLQDQHHVQIRCFVGDIGKYDFAQTMIEAVLAEFEKIDILINNAGVSWIGLLTEMTPFDWEQVISANLTSMFATCRLIAPSMVARKSGRIINISSVWGRVGASCEAVYAASKGGVDAFTKSLGKELAPCGIPVNAVACGMIDTEMNRCFSVEERDAILAEIPAARMGTPEEAAALVLLLCSAPVYFTGQILTLDGGWT